MGGFETQINLHIVIEHPKKNFEQRSYGRPKLENKTRKSGALNLKGPTVFYQFRS